LVFREPMRISQKGLQLFCGHGPLFGHRLIEQNLVGLAIAKVRGFGQSMMSGRNPRIQLQHLNQELLFPFAEMEEQLVVR
jgi:hypothetical protein